MYFPMSSTNYMWPSSCDSQLSYGRRGLSKVPLFDREAVSVRKEGFEESAMLEIGWFMWTCLRENAQVRLSHLPEDLPQRRRMRGCTSALSTAVWQAEKDLRTPLRKGLPRAFNMQGGHAMSFKDHHHLRLPEEERGGTLQRPWRYSDPSWPTNIVEV